MILECNVWCSENDQNRDLGLPDGDCWMPIAIDLIEVKTIKEAGRDDFIGDCRATLYLSGEHFIIDLSYTDAVTLWRKEKDNKK